MRGVTLLQITESQYSTNSKKPNLLSLCFNINFNVSPSVAKQKTSES